MVIADLDFALITKRKRMMDSVGHYARPELLSLRHDDRATTTRTTAAAEDRSTTHDDNRDTEQPASDHRSSVARLASG